MMKFLILSVCLSICNLLSNAQTFRINEVMSSNVGFITDSDGDASDWIELLNTGTNGINLNGYGLSDNKLEPFKWAFPDYTLGQGEFMLVFASDKAISTPPIYWNTIIGQGDTWKYLVPTAEPSASWRNASFADTNWNTGASGFGMGDNDDATTVTVGKSIFLRKKFNIANVATVKQLLLHMDYDDGFVAYINGDDISMA